MAMVPFIEPDPDAQPDHSIRVVWANVALNTLLLNAALEYARMKEADLVLIGEFPIAKQLTPEFAPDFPFRADTGAHPDDFYRRTRVVALSRLPVEDVLAVAPGDASGRKFLTFDLCCGADDQTIRIASAHVLFPMRSFSHAAQPEFIATLAGELKEPFLFAGDLNAAPWSWVYRLLSGQRIGDPKWETTYRRPGLSAMMSLAMPIDHFLVGPNIGVTEYEIGPDTGGDHRPLFAAVYLLSGEK